MVKSKSGLDRYSTSLSVGAFKCTTLKTLRWVIGVTNGISCRIMTSQIVGTFMLQWICRGLSVTSVLTLQEKKTVLSGLRLLLSLSAWSVFSLFGTTSTKWREIWAICRNFTISASKISREKPILRLKKMSITRKVWWMGTKRSLWRTKSSSCARVVLTLRKLT